MTHSKMNKIVFSQLAVATVDGTAFHIVRQFNDEKDGYKAWKALIEWYEGDVVKNETAEELRQKLESLNLHSNVTASHYVNRFLTLFHDLNRIPGEEVSDSHAVYLFLRNIHDNEYASTVLYLRNTNASMKECVNIIRKTERDLSVKRANRRKLRHILRRTKSKRKRDNEDDMYISGSESEEEMIKNRPKRFKGIIEPRKSGLIGLDPQDWKNLSEEKKKFIQEYNAKVKHGENPTELEVPNGIVIQNKPRRKKDDDKKNKHDENDSNDEDEPPKKRPRHRKNILFPVESGDETSNT